MSSEPNIRDFAERILYGNSLEDKLYKPISFTETKPSLKSFQTPRYPGRPLALDLESWQSRAKVEFPKTDKLYLEKNRGLVLHFFANHELLAIELMALVLLKFPDSPASFQQGILRTIFEEQKHMLMYQKRMQEFCVEFGEIPVNDYFWAHLSKMDNPLDFVTQMSLTFEQANLDFCVHYKNIFEKIGDIETACLMEVVYQEEIGHVKHGLSWFNRWKDPDKDDWDAYVSLLKSPLTPQRAKGIGFDFDARQKSGLSERFIRELSVFSASKGRPPDIYCMNFSCESEVARGKSGFHPVRHVLEMTRELSVLSTFLAKKDDVALVSEKPSFEFLDEIRNFGFEMPEYLVYKDSPTFELPEGLRERKIGYLEPWGWSQQTHTQLKPLLKNSVKKDRNYSKILNAISREGFAGGVHSKAWSTAVAGGFSLENSSTVTAESRNLSTVYFTLDEALQATRVFAQSPFCEKPFRAVIKAPFGSSGQKMLRVTDAELTEAQKEWMKRILISEGCLIVEPWLDKIADFSIQFCVDSKGKVVINGLTRFFTDLRGQYRGSIVGRMMDGFDKGLVRFLQGEGSAEKSLQFHLACAANYVGKKLFESGYSGPAGIDSLIHMAEGVPQIRPIVEVNPRFTMGRVALELSRRISVGSLGVWVHFCVDEIKACGFVSNDEFVSTLRQRFERNQLPTIPPTLVQGVLCTNDPTTAKRVLTLLIVGRNFDEIESCFVGKAEPLKSWVQPLKGSRYL